MATATAPRQEATTTAREQPQNQDASILDKVLQATVEKLDSEASRYFAAIQDDAMGTMYRAVVLAKGIAALRKSIEPVMPFFMDLQGSDLGFKTDKEKDGGYPKEVVRDCLVTAFLMGVYPTGNMMNIIAGRCYITKNGWEKKLLDIPGLTNLECIAGVPAMRDGHTCVRALVKWTLNGVKQQLLGTDGQPGRVFPIRVNQGMIVDAILGKAKGKAYHAAYETIKGRDFLPVEDGELAEGEIATTPPPTGNVSLKNGTPKAAPVETPVPEQVPETPPPPVFANEKIAAAIKREAVAQGTALADVLKPYRVRNVSDLTQEQAQEALDMLRGGPESPPEQLPTTQDRTF